MKSCQRFISFLEESAYELRSSFQFKKTLCMLMYEHHINYLAYTI